jgi:hypothetical protein
MIKALKKLGIERPHLKVTMATLPSYIEWAKS